MHQLAEQFSKALVGNVPTRPPLAPPDISRLFALLHFEEMGEFLLHIPLASEGALAATKPPPRGYEFRLRVFFDPRHRVQELHPQHAGLLGEECAHLRPAEQYYETRFRVAYAGSRLTVLPNMIRNGTKFLGSIKHVRSHLLHKFMTD